MSHAEAEIRRRGAIPDEIGEAGASGERARREVGRLAYEINVQQYACAGLNFGTYYDRSPIIAYDGGDHPSYTMSDYTPSTVPGCRTPHMWCEDGASLYDAMGPEFTLLRFDPAVDVASLEAAARKRRVPLKVLDVERPAGAIFYRHTLVLSRPDQHVAWRGDRPAGGSAGVDRSCPRRGAPTEGRMIPFAYGGSRLMHFPVQWLHPSRRRFTPHQDEVLDPHGEERGNAVRLEPCGHQIVIRPNWNTR